MLSPLAVLASGAILACLPGQAQAISDKECQRPLPPEVPQAATASEVEMISTRVRINMYVEAANAFMACLDEAEQSMGETGREVKERRIRKKREEIQKEIVEIAESYNEQVAVFRERFAEPQAEGDSGGPASGAPAKSPTERSEPASDSRSQAQPESASSPE